MSIRTFLALDLDDTLLDGLEEVRTRLDDSQSKIRWVARQNIHLTMRFLGDVAEDVIPLVCERTAAVAEQIAPFDFELRGITCVPPRGGQVRMVWAGVADPVGQLAALHEALAEGLTDLDVKQETRGFKPHLTIARVKSVRDPGTFREMAAIYSETDFGIQHATELVAYSSQLAPQGPIYSAIARATLGG